MSSKETSAYEYAELALIAENLLKYAGEIGSVAEEMKRLPAPEIQVRYRKSIGPAEEFVKKFAGSARDGLNAYKKAVARGEIPAQAPAATEPTKKPETKSSKSKKRSA